MKKIAAVLLAIVMVFAIGCQRKEASISSNSNTTLKQEETAKNLEDTNSVATSKTQGTTEAQAGNTSTATTTPTTTDKSSSTTKTTTQTKKEPQKEATSTFTILITKDRGKVEILKKELTIDTEKSLMDYLRDNTDVTDEGGFLKSIEGYTAVLSNELSADQKSAGIMGVDWFIYRNNEKTKSGAGDITPTKGDIIQLDYREWTYKDLAP